MSQASGSAAAHSIYHENQIMTAPIPELAVLVHAGACSSLRRARNQDGRYSQMEVRAQLFRSRSLLYLLKDSLVLHDGPVARKLYQVYDQLITSLEGDDALQAECLDFVLEIMATLQRHFEAIKRRATLNTIRRPVGIQPAL